MMNETITHLAEQLTSYEHKPAGRISPPYLVERLDQLEALGSPARRELIEAVQLLGECSIAEVAEILGKPADSLYYHVRKLLQVGLLKQVGVRRGSRREEAIYDLPGRPLRVRYDARDPNQAELLVAAAAADLRLTERNVRAAVEDGGVVPDGPDRNMVCNRHRRPLTTVQLEAINDHLRAIDSIMNEPADAEAAAEGRVFALTVALTPVEARPANRRAED